MKLSKMLAIHALFAPDDGSNGSATPPAGNAAAAPEATTVTPPTSGGEVRTFTQDEVNGIVAERLQRDRARAIAPPAAQTPPPKPVKESPADKDVRLAEMESSQSFMYAYMDSGLSLNQAQREVMQGGFSKAQPENHIEWIKQRALDLGFGTSPPSNAEAKPVNPPANQPGPPPSQRTSEDTPLAKMSPEDRNHILATKGRTYYAQRLRQEMRTTTIDIRNGS